MTDEQIHRYCCVCGARIPGNLTAYELVDRGAGSLMADGSIQYHCIGRHSEERIRNAAKFYTGFHRASQEQREVSRAGR